jgi:hypothetical protein
MSSCWSELSQKSLSASRKSFLYMHSELWSSSCPWLLHIYHAVSYDVLFPAFVNTIKVSSSLAYEILE